MSEALAVQAEFQPMTAAQVRAQVNLVQEVMKAVMIGPSKDNPSGTHYGLVPGCGNKPTLFKAGAEKLMMTFRLAADPQVQEIPTDDGITFRVICRITNQATGVFLGSGIGECSSKEEKYNWRKAVCDGEYNETPEDKRRGKWVKGFKNEPDKQIKQVRTNPPDIANTVLKMAKKRALVDAILTVTAASDIFDQDLEDMPEALRQSDAQTRTKASTVQPADSGQSATAPATETTKDVRQALKDELGAYCGGDVAKMKQVLKEVSKFTTAEGKELSITDIDKAKEGWVGKSLSALRELAKNGGANRGPDPISVECLLNPETCADSNFSPDAQGNLVAGCTHPMGNGVCGPGKGKTY